MYDGNLIINEGSSIGVVGESGSGKTQLLKTIAGTQEMIPGIINGSVTFHIKGKKQSMYVKNKKKYYLNKKSFEIKKDLIGFIPQDPRSFLNPFWTLEKLFNQTYKIRERKITLHQFIENYFEKAGIVTESEPFDIDFIKKTPSALSGGQAQRVMIALVLSKEPKLIIADESTTGLDVTTQKIIIDTFNSIRRLDPEITMIFISHDFGFLTHVVDEYYVLYGGFICEHITDKKQLFSNTSQLHPYTQDLISSLKTNGTAGKEGELSVSVDLSEQLQGCSYYTECKLKNSNDKLEDLCCNTVPPIINTDNDKNEINLNLKWQRCWLKDE